jgi:hypothetical protein
VKLHCPSRLSFSAVFNGTGSWKQIGFFILTLYSDQDLSTIRVGLNWAHFIQPPVAARPIADTPAATASCQEIWLDRTVPILWFGVGAGESRTCARKLACPADQPMGQKWK